MSVDSSELRLARPLLVRAAPRREAVGLGADLGGRGHVRRQGLVRAAGESLSLQFHREKDESWYIESGRARLELGDVGQEVLDEEIVTAGACFRYRPGTVHRVTAIEDTTILEVSTPHLDDVVRLEDRYGREGTSAA